jgi:hypothetical protein
MDAGIEARPAEGRWRILDAAGAIGIGGGGGERNASSGGKSQDGSMDRLYEHSFRYRPTPAGTLAAPVSRHLDRSDKHLSPHEHALIRRTGVAILQWRRRRSGGGGGTCNGLARCEGAGAQVEPGSGARGS